MDWIFDHFQIFILVALGVGSVLKSLWEAKAKAKRQAEEGYELEEDEGPDQQFGGPQMPQVLPPPLQRQTPPPLRESGYDAAVAIETAAALKHQQDLAAHLARIRETRATTTGGAAATRARISRKGASKPISKSQVGIRSRLRDPVEVRRAFVMREILDPPVGLR